jgi:ketosteroid isomerase-like protein
MISTLCAKQTGATPPRKSFFMTDPSNQTQANKALITRFYTAFAARDGAAMTQCYHPNARFSDPGFVDLRGPEVSAMWRMLTSRSKDLALTFSDVAASEHGGSAKWVARYTFSATGRAVENRIVAAFVFRDGLILEHNDLFDFWRWAAQALGPIGSMLGWSGFLRRKVQKQARANLVSFMAKENASSTG